MLTPRTRLRLVMLQVRANHVPQRQEQSCFIERCQVARHQMTFINLVEQPQLRWRHVEEAHAVLIGGAGAYSVTDEHPFTEALHDVVNRLIDDNRPIFGSCWGHQFLAASHGCEVIQDKESAEVGSRQVHLTEAGSLDRVFSDLPVRFTVQLGHNDRVSTLGPGWVELAYSDLCRNQAIRLHDRPVYGTQFHSEMNEERLRERIEIYRDDYTPEPEDYERMIRSLRPSLEADQILTRFLEAYA